MALDAERVARALSGDVAAVRELTDMLTPVIHSRVARVLLRCRAGQGARDLRAEIEDLTQDVFLALFDHDARTLRSWDPARGASLVTFVGLVAERQAISWLRSRKTNLWTEQATRCEDLEQQPKPEASLETVVASRQLLEALARRLLAELSPKGQLLFSLLLVEQRSIAEVCDLLQMRPDAVYAWRSRLSRRLRTLASEMLSEERCVERT